MHAVALCLSLCLSIGSDWMQSTGGGDIRQQSPHLTATLTAHTVTSHTPLTGTQPPLIFTFFVTSSRVPQHLLQPTLLTGFAQGTPTIIELGSRATEYI